MNPRYFDIHSHVTDPQYDADRTEVLARMREANVTTITIGTDYETSRQAIALAQEDANIYACIGLHPEEGEGFDRAAFEELAGAARVVAVGECGLDYFRTNDPLGTKARQLPVFEAQIQMALDYDLPLMLHVRASKGTLDAYDDVLDVLSSYAREHQKLRGNAHFFAADVARAKRFLELGFTLSFTGVITFARDYDEVIEYAPLDMIHAETDAPYVAPKPYRGSRNEPSYVSEVVNALGAIRGLAGPDIARQLAENASRVFRFETAA
jgi:TatD DNase family protein